jgi:hypothetical protein
MNPLNRGMMVSQGLKTSLPVHPVATRRRFAFLLFVTKMHKSVTIIC